MSSAVSGHTVGSHLCSVLLACCSRSVDRALTESGDFSDVWNVWYSSAYSIIESRRGTCISITLILFGVVQLFSNHVSICVKQFFHWAPLRALRSRSLPALGSFLHALGAGRPCLLRGRPALLAQGPARLACSGAGALLNVSTTRGTVPPSTVTAQHDRMPSQTLKCF